MSRWIDADELGASVIKNTVFDKGDVIKLIENAPSIEIIRCGECKWLDSGKNDSEVWSMCTRHFGKYFDVNADDFCSYGCRKEE